MARLAAIEEALIEEANERQQWKLYLRNTFNIERMPDVEFISSYRLNRQAFEILCQEVVPLLRPTKNRRALSPITKILTALKFYGRGSYQGDVALNMDAPMGQPSVSRSINEVTDVLNTPRLLFKYIRFPQNRTERQTLKTKFANKSNIPGALGCIDCTHVAIVRPKLHEEQFFNRKHFHSLNVQVIIDCDVNILNIDASYGGATHDAFIWDHHDVKQHLENLQDETVFLLGDSGYPLRHYLLTPIEGAAENSPQARYNKIHVRGRNCVERAFGLLKGRWRCLLAARELHYSPETAGKIVLACALLHNLCNLARSPPSQLTIDEQLEENERQSLPLEISQSSNSGLARGRLARESLMQQLELNR